MLTLLLQKILFFYLIFRNHFELNGYINNLSTKIPKGFKSLDGDPVVSISRFDLTSEC